MYEVCEEMKFRHDLKSRSLHTQGLKGCLVESSHEKQPVICNPVCVSRFNPQRLMIDGVHKAVDCDQAFIDRSQMRFILLAAIGKKTLVHA